MVQSSRITDNLKKVAEISQSKSFLIHWSGGWNFQVSGTLGETQLDGNLLCSEIFEKFFFSTFQKVFETKPKLESEFEKRGIFSKSAADTTNDFFCYKTTIYLSCVEEV